MSEMMKSIEFTLQTIFGMVFKLPIGGNKYPLANLTIERSIANESRSSPASDLQNKHANDTTMGRPKQN